MTPSSRAAAPTRGRSRPSSEERLTPRSSVEDVVGAYLAVVDARRDARAALSHVRAELGSMPIRAVRPRHLKGLEDDLRESGLSEERLEAFSDALRSLFGFADTQGLLEADPTEPPRREAPSPTLAMLSFGARLAVLATWIVVLAFAGLVIALFFLLA